MRAFFAISIPPKIGLSLMTLVPPVKSIRKAKPDNLHLTLHFLPDAPETLPTDLPNFFLPPPFPLTPARLILLPESGPIRIIAASLKSDLTPLKQLHSNLAAALTTLNPPTESRPYLPHITLARCDPPLPQQVRSQTPMTPREDLTFQVHHLHLIESRPTERGFEYITLKTWNL